MDEQAYEAFTRQLKVRLMADPRVIGLITLGSTADATQRDEWSDHDFWVITLLSLLIAHTVAGHTAADRLDPRRKIEQLHPAWAHEIQQCYSLSMAEAGAHLLGFAQRVIQPVVPEMAWDRVLIVKGWLEHVTA
jgi:hypothetical protein